MVKTGRQAAATSQTCSGGGDGFILDLHWFGLCELSDLTSFSFAFFSFFYCP